jgi:hypothetical protein
MAIASDLATLSGLILAALAFVWLVALAFETSAWWGISVLIFPPLALVFALGHFRRAWEPLAIAVGASVLAVVPWLNEQHATARHSTMGMLAALSSEQGAFWLLVSGAALAALGFLGLVVAAFRTRVGWGFGVLLFPPSALIFVPRHWSQARGAAGLILLGLAVMVTPFVLTRYVVPIDLGPRERIVDGERHITLTGWDRHDYSFLREKPDVVVLQIANPDVTDATLESLTGMARLRELDIERSAITDRGLRVLARLPALETLHLKDTNITDAGFREALGSSGTLRMLDVRGTPVSAETIQAWRKAKPGRRVLH